MINLDLEALDLSTIDWDSIKAPTVDTVLYSELSCVDKKLFEISWKTYHMDWFDQVNCQYIGKMAKCYKSHTDKGLVGFISLVKISDEEFKFYFCEPDPLHLSFQYFSQFNLQFPFKMPVVFFERGSNYLFEGCLGKQVFADLALFLSSEINIEECLSKNCIVSKTRQQPEQKLEDQLYDWLRIKDIDVERQVATAKHRLDLWIPSKAMLELKQGRVSGDDVCQAIDYAATYQMPIVLVGTGLSTAASRGIDGFNRAMAKDLIIFVTWGGVKSYLNGLLR